MMSKYGTLTLLTVLTCIGFLMPSAAQVPAEPDTMPVRGIMPYSDQIMSSIDSIDPATRKLHVSIPLGSLPDGRGGSGFEISLKYDSNLFSSRKEMKYVGDSWNMSWQMLEHPEYAGPHSGWSFNFANIGFEYDERQTFDERLEPPIYPPDCSLGKKVRFRYRIWLPDGSNHIMYLHPKSSDPYFWWPDGYTAIAPTGDESGCTPGDGWPDQSEPLEFYSVDGTFLKLEMPFGSIIGQWTLYYPDGRRVVGNSTQVSEIYDANQNKITITNIVEDPECPTVAPCTRISYDNGSDETGRKILVKHGVDSLNGYSRTIVKVPGPNRYLEWAIDYNGNRPPMLTQYDPLWNEYGQYELPQDIDMDGYSIISFIHTPSPDETTDDFPDLNGIANNYYGQLETHRYYKFDYTGYDDYGLAHLNYIRIPLGAENSYQYTNEGVPALDTEVILNNIFITGKTIEFNDGDVNNNNNPGNPDNPDKLTWSYGDQVSGGIVVTNPDGGQTKYYEAGLDELRGLIGRIVEPNGNERKRLWQQNSVFGSSGTPYGQNMYIARESYAVANTSGTPTYAAVTDFTYDKNGNLTYKTEYDWVPYAGPDVVETGTTIKRKTKYDYYLTTNDTTNAYWNYDGYYSNPDLPRRLNAVKRKTVYDGSGNPVAATEYVYDNAYTTGNVRYEYRWDNVKSPGFPSSFSVNNSQVFERRYDSYGNVTRVYDPTGVSEPDIWTEITYDALGNHIVRIDKAFGWPERRSAEYLWNDGGTAIDSKTDVDNNLTINYRYDNYGRKVSVDELGLRVTTTEYDDENGKITVTSGIPEYEEGIPFVDKIQQYNETVTSYDNVGRVRLTQSYEGLALTDEDKGIKTKTYYSYPAGGRRVVTSTPYRSLLDDTLEWTCTQYDLNNRIRAVSMFKGSSAPTNCWSGTNLTGITTMTFAPYWTLITDPAGKKRYEVFDALGRLVRVDEDPTGNNDKTYYYYDPLDNLTRVDQGVQTRTFNYSSLSRLKNATNPESGAIYYTYYDSGDLKTRTDARNIVTTMTYDPLHRITSKTYSDTTPDVHYTYHLAGTSFSPNIGQLESVSSDVAISLYGYTPLGQVDISFHNVTGYTGDLIFDYDWYTNGSLKSLEYPTGRLVNYDLDAAGRTETVYTSGKTYAEVTGNDGYTPDGRLAEMELGNGLWVEHEFHTPGTDTVYRLGTYQGGGDLLQINYEFGATNNNGNLIQQEIRRQGQINPFIQKYQYDGVNRLARFEEYEFIDPSEYLRIFRDYGYDRYGNRWVSLSTGLSYVDTREPDDPNDFNPNNNRLTTPDYDDAGNQTSFGAYSAISYDAEGRVSSMTGTGVGSAAYSYDGDGRRVKKVWSYGGTTETTYYFYNALGQLSLEYSADVPVSTETTYPFADMLGSVREVTDQNGDVTESYDYLPFGRMLSASDNGRGGYHPQNPDYFIASSMPQKFTGKERDETGLDYFGARYFSGALGRFTSTDPLLNSGRPWNPQSWNRYAFVLNNPLKYTDPTGLYSVTACDAGDTKCDEWRKRLKTALNNARESLKSDNLSKEEKEKLRATLDYLGTDGDGNKVRISFKSIKGEATGELAGNNKIRIDMAKIESNFQKPGMENFDLTAQVGGTAVHEGTHGNDLATGIFDFRIRNSQKDQDLKAFEAAELRAWDTESFLFKGQNISSPDGLWNTSWEEADREKLRSTGVQQGVQRSMDALKKGLNQSR